MNTFGRKAIIGVLAIASIGTLLLVLLGLSFAYENHDVHIALETSATFVALLAAAIVYGRAKQSADRADVALFIGLLLLAGSNLGRLLASDFDGENHLVVWLPLTARMVAAGTLTLAAFIPRGRQRAPYPPGIYAVGAVSLSAVAVGLVAILGSDLATGIDASRSPADSSNPQIDGSAALLATQVTSVALFAAAALGFALRARRTGEELLAWLAAGMLLGSLARFQFLMFPSTYSDWVFTGDILFLVSYLLIFTGALRDILANQRSAARAEVLEERTRLARDLHDGLAQDLAYLSVQAQRLSGDDPQAARIAQVAKEALVQSRGVIGNLRISDAPLGEATATLARALAARHDLELTLSIDESLDAPAEERDDLLRIVSEAIANAARHGGSSNLAIELDEQTEGTLRLRVTDDGSGFDVSELKSGSGLGLRGMRERVERHGGRLVVSSRFGAGTTIEVVL